MTPQNLPHSEVGISCANNSEVAYSFAMKTAVVALALTLACSTLARPQQTPTTVRPITFFDVLDLPVRVDEPELEKNASDYSLTCAVANRSDEPLTGLRFALLLIDSSNNRQITRLTWDEVSAVPAFSIKTFKFHLQIKDELKAGNLFLAVDEVIGRDTIWRTVEAEKLLRAYARGDHGLSPKVQKLQNKFDKESPRGISSQLPLRPKP
jgi:hypothetical protein